MLTNSSAGRYLQTEVKPYAFPPQSDILTNFFWWSHLPQRRDETKISSRRSQVTRCDELIELVQYTLRGGRRSCDFRTLTEETLRNGVSKEAKILSGGFLRKRGFSIVLSRQMGPLHWRLEGRDEDLSRNDASIGFYSIDFGLPVSFPTLNFILLVCKSI